MKRVGWYVAIFTGILCLVFLGVPAAQAQFTPLTGIPGVSTQPKSVVDYLNSLFFLCITLGALFAVIKIAVAGFEFAMSDIITDKGDAKKDIQGALVGLLILLGTYVFLYTINPQLTNLNIFKNLKFIETKPVNVPTLSSGEILPANMTRAQELNFTNDCTERLKGTVRKYSVQNQERVCCDTGGDSCSEAKKGLQNEFGIDTTKVYKPEELVAIEEKYKDQFVQLKKGETCGIGKIFSVQQYTGAVRNGREASTEKKPVYYCMTGIQAGE